MKTKICNFKLHANLKKKNSCIPIRALLCAESVWWWILVASGKCNTTCLLRHIAIWSKQHSTGWWYVQVAERCHATDIDTILELICSCWDKYSIFMTWPIHLILLCSVTHTCKMILLLYLRIKWDTWFWMGVQFYICNFFLAIHRYSLEACFCYHCIYLIGSIHFPNYLFNIFIHVFEQLQYFPQNHLPCLLYLNFTSVKF